MNSDEAFDDLRQEQLERAHDNIKQERMLWKTTDGESFGMQKEAVSHQYKIEKEL